MDRFRIGSGTPFQLRGFHNFGAISTFPNSNACFVLYTVFPKFFALTGYRSGKIRMIREREELELFF